MYQAQEVAAVIATERYIAADGVEAVEVEYEPLDPIVDRSAKRCKPNAPGCFGQEGSEATILPSTGKRVTTRRRKSPCGLAPPVCDARTLFAAYPRCIDETCGCIADFDAAQGKLTFYMTTQAPHAVRTVFALVAGHVGFRRSGFASFRRYRRGLRRQVPVYPGYVIAVAATVVIGKPVKWIEDRMENLQADSFAATITCKSNWRAARRHDDGAAHPHRGRSRLSTRRQSVEVSRWAVFHLHRLL